MNLRTEKSGDRITIPIRRRLRQNLTPAEKIFWNCVRGKQLNGLKFRRQHGIGKYIVDFYCVEKKLIIEIDGDSHTTASIIIIDRVRTNYLFSLGYKIIRYNNRDVLYNISGVLEDLVNKLTPSNSPSRGGG